MWVQLRSIQYFTENGKQVTKYPGDWVNVGKQQARLWLSRGDAVLPGGNGHAEITSEESGIVVTGSVEFARRTLEVYGDQLQIEETEPTLIYEHTMIWDTSLHIQREMVPVGFSFLDTWQLAVPLWDYTQLAVSVGKPDERDRTAEVIRDLRVPLYDTRLMFVKRCPDTVKLFDLWLSDVEDGEDVKLSFLRALYKVKPYVLALPVTWTDVNAPR